MKVKGVELIFPFLTNLLLMFSSGDNELFCDTAIPGFCLWVLQSARSATYVFFTF